MKVRRCMEVLNERDESLLIAVEPLELAEQVCRRLVDEVEATADGALFLHAKSAWTGPITTVLVKKGATISELRYVGRCRAH
jgi:hypothetical protein